MIALALALALAAQDPAASDTAVNQTQQSAEAAPAALPEQTPPEQPAPDAPPRPEDVLPTGAPREDYPFVAWCYGSLRGYLDLHDYVMPEVKRIEGAFRRPGSSLEDDLKVYADMQADGKKKLVQFQSALTAAEKASIRPINLIGGAAVRQGQSVWARARDVPKARAAQEWMSWTLPARCEAIAASLEARSLLAAAALRTNLVEAPSPAESPAPASADAPPASADVPVSPAEGAPPSGDPPPAKPEDVSSPGA